MSPKGVQWWALSDSSGRKGNALLADWDYLRIEVVPSTAASGRPSEHYRINPHVFTKAAT